MVKEKERNILNNANSEPKLTAKKYIQEEEQCANYNADRRCGVFSINTQGSCVSIYKCSGVLEEAKFEGTQIILVSEFEYCRESLVG